jgi:hypothetical protein
MSFNHFEKIIWLSLCKTKISFKVIGDTFSSTVWTNFWLFHRILSMVRWNNQNLVHSYEERCSSVKLKKLTLLLTRFYRTDSLNTHSLHIWFLLFCAREHTIMLLLIHYYYRCLWLAFKTLSAISAETNNYDSLDFDTRKIDKR